MAKRKKSRNKANKNKKQKKERFWIESVEESPTQGECDMLVYISRTLLEDSHTYSEKHVMDQKACQSVIGPSAEASITRIPDGPAVIERSRLPKLGKGTPLDPNDPRICIRYKESRKEPWKPFHRFSRNFKHLPNGDCGDGVVNPTPNLVADHYWAQRKRFFSKFDSGIKIDKEGWFSVTPEAIAEHIANRLCSGCSEMVVLDAFVGVGANAIAFARRPEVKLVICVDNDEARLELAANNFKVYQIPEEKILLLNCDATEVLSRYQGGTLRVSSDLEEVEKGPNGESSGTDAPSDYRLGDLDDLPRQLDAIFLSPPWGGEAYGDTGPKGFKLSHISVNSSTNGKELLAKALQSIGEARRLAYFLPRNLDGDDAILGAFSCNVRCIELEQNILCGKLKTVTMYAHDPLL